MREDDHPTRPPGDSSDEGATVPPRDPGQDEMEIGPYRLRQRVGAGGMGEVWLAEQSAPIQRKVALKIIRRGMDSKEVVARFEAERQALALMNHACVAKVFDAGTTPRGRPYFAMEYVPGVPVTEYCDRHKMGLHQRLELFQRVCEGVQHAHQKAIIHRDLKPSNVLVMEQDGVPTPKIIDFGVAKATSQKLTEKTMFTQLGVLIGTPEYMSPEQADLTGEDVDTRTDVYSLGVILYELLVGALPFEPTELRRAGFDGIRKMIREQEPPRPSTRVSTRGEGSAAHASSRGVTVAAWQHKLRGDLDWITMKALEKDRGRRYSSALELAKDVSRHLENLPVEARPPTLSYRTGRFIRRNRIAVGFATTLLILILAAGAALAVLYARSSRAEKLAAREAETSNRALEFMTGLFRGSDPFERGAEPLSARQLLDRGALQLRELDTQPDVQIRLMTTIGDVYRELGSWDEARAILGSALERRIQLAGGERDLDVAEIQWFLGYNEVLAERYDVAEQLIKSCLQTRLELLDEEAREVVHSRQLLAFCYVRMNRFADAEGQSRRLVDVARRKYADDPRDFADYLFTYGWALAGLQRWDEAFPLFEEALQVRRDGGEWKNPATGWTLNCYGRYLIDEGSEPNVRRGIQMLEEALQINTELFDGWHAEIAFNSANIAAGYRRLENYEAAERYSRRALEIAGEFFDASGYLGSWTRGLVAAIANQGRYEEAEKILLDLLETQMRMPEAQDQIPRGEKMLEQLYEEWGRPEKYAQWRTRSGRAD